MPRFATRVRYGLARFLLKSQDFSIVPAWVRTSVLHPGFRSLTRDGYQKSSAFFACLSTLAFSFPEPPLGVFDAEGDEGQPMPGHALRRLVARPMPGMDESELLATTMVYLGIGGNAYWHKVRGPGKRVIKLKPYHAGHLIPVPGGPDWVDHYDYDASGSAGRGDVSGRLPEVDPADVIHFKWPSVDPAQPWQSQPPIMAAASEVDSDVEAIAYIYALLKNDAIPRTVLTVPADRPLDEEEIKRMREQWRERYGGSARGEIAILEGGTTVQRLGLGLQELGFDALAKVSESRIAAVMRVPPILAGLNVGLDRSTFSNYGEARKAFTQDTLAPLWRMFASKLTASLLPDFGGLGGVEVRFDLSRVASLQEDATQRYNRAVNAYKAGLLQKNEARRLIGFADVAGGEAYFSASASSGGGGAFGKPANGDPAQLEDSTASEASSPKTFLLLGDGSLVELPSGAARIVKAQPRAIASTVEQKESLDGLEGSAERALATYLRAEYRKAAEGVRNGGKSGEVDPSVVEQLGLDLGPGVQRIMRKIYPKVLQEAFKDAELALDVDIGFDVANDEVQSVLGELADLVKRITDTTRNAIQSLVSRAADEGWSIDRLAKELVEHGGIVSKSRARMIARTETATAYSMGSLLAYAKSGVVDQVEWLTTIDDQTCPDCKGLNGETRKLDKVFSDGTAHPPRHPNCRCSLAPVVK
jgi:HK97 family phage portal protein